MSVENDLVEHLKGKGNWTLAFAESCTGGDLAARITKIPGASAIFVGSIVAYSENLKKGLLSIPPELFPDKIVSEDMAKEMLKGIMSMLEPMIGVSVTGFAGPSGPDIGDVWVAFQKKGEEPKTLNLHLQGNREEIIHQIGDIIFAKLKDEIAK